MTAINMKIRNASRQTKKSTLLGAICLLILLAPMSIAVAQTETVEGEILSVDVSARTIDISYKAALGQTSTSLDISKKADITINGVSGTLESLRKGQKVSVTYNKDLDVITAIQATGDVQTSEFVTIAELDGSFPTLTQDGRMVFYESRGSSEPMITSATRDNSDRPFENVEQLFPGRHPAISGDGLELIFLHLPAGKKTRTLHVATRKSLKEPFGRLLEIRELSHFAYPRGAFLAEDALTLCFRSSEEDGQIVQAIRKTRTSPWSKPQPLLTPDVERKLGGMLTWPALSNDGLALLATLEKGNSYEKTSNLYVLTRSDPSQPFSQATPIENDALPPLVRSPRFVESTKELFISGVPNTEPQFAIGVVKGFSSLK